MSREDLAVTNAEIVKGVVVEAVKRSPDAVLIVVTNPMDTMAQLALKVSGFASAEGGRHGRHPRLGTVQDLRRLGTRRIAGGCRSPRAWAATVTRWSRCPVLRR